MLDHLVVHIGHAKTGTTSLQDTLRDNAGLLAERGWHYEARFRSHHQIARSFRLDPAQVRPREKQHLRQMYRALERTRLPNALVSSEAFSILTNDQTARCVEVLSSFARRLSVLLYVRHPLAFANSAVSQGVRGGRSLAEIIERPTVLPLRRMIERWSALVEAENFTVRPYDRAQLVGRDVIDDVLAHLRLEEIAPKLERRQANESLSGLGLVLLDRAQRMYPRGTVPIDAQRPFQAIEGKSFVLPEASQRDVMERSRKYLAYLEERYGIVLPQPVLEPTPLPVLDQTTLDSLARVLVRYGLHGYQLERSLLGRHLGARAPLAGDWDRPRLRLGEFVYRRRWGRRLLLAGPFEPFRAKPRAPARTAIGRPVKDPATTNS